MVRAWAVVAVTMTQTQTSGNGLLNICIGVGKPTTCVVMSRRLLASE